MRNRNPQQRLFIGSMIIIIGVLALIQNLAIFNIRHILQFWPVVFMVLGGLKINQSEDLKGRFLGVILVITGAVMTLNHLGIIDTNMHDWWPLFLIMAGVLILFKIRPVKRSVSIQNLLYRHLIQTKQPNFHKICSRMRSYKSWLL